MPDVIVVGAGPAGMAAAAAASAGVLAVVLVDGAPRLGGQYFRQPLAEPPNNGDQPVPPAGPRLPARFHHLTGNPAVELRLGCEVWSVSKGPSGFTILLTDGVPAALHSPALVMATGASELTLPFPGWELPGVATAGAAQALLKSQHVPIGRRVVVAGTGPFLLPVAAALAEAGSRVLVVEAAQARSAPRAMPTLLRHPQQAEGGGRIRPGAGPTPGAGAHRLGGRPLRGRGLCRAVVLARLGPNGERLTETAPDRPS